MMEIFTVIGIIVVVGLALFGVAALVTLVIAR